MSQFSATPSHDFQPPNSHGELIVAWKNEALCPEILPFKTDLIASIKEALTRQQTMVDQQFDSAEQDESSDIYFTATIYQMEIERVRYSLARYLRTRILKIEKTLESIMADVEVQERLSFDEQVFATKLKELTDEHFESTISSRMNRELRKALETADDRRENARPDVDEFVFCKISEDIHAPDLVGISSDTDIENLRRDHIHIFPYSSIRNYVLDGKIQLI